MVQSHTPKHQRPRDSGGEGVQSSEAVTPISSMGEKGPQQGVPEAATWAQRTPPACREEKCLPQGCQAATVAGRQRSERGCICEPVSERESSDLKGAGGVCSLQ